MDEPKKQDEPKKKILTQTKGGPSISISSPRTGGTVNATTGKVVGVYDLQGSVFSKIECEFLQPGTATSAASPFGGKIVDATRKVWSADINTSLSGKYDLIARLYVTGKVDPADTDTVTAVYIDATPKVSIASPPDLTPINARTVQVSVNLAANHGFTLLTCRLVDGLENEFFPLSTKVGAMNGNSAVTKVEYTAYANKGDHYRFEATAKGGTETPILVSTGEILLT